MTTLNLQHIAARLKSMQVERRVRATADIRYVTSGIEVAFGSRGTIKSVSHGGALVAVLWDGMREAIWTAYEGVEIVPPGGLN